ncbi:hypothetical protein [Klebsiella phage pKP-BM327-1.2]|nr:hypothetical protein [Klebsiella phage pKP-BM327-1.2]
MVRMFIGVSCKEYRHDNCFLNNGQHSPLLR